MIGANAAELLQLADRVARNEIVFQCSDAHALVDVLASEMLANYDEEERGLNEQGLAIDDMIGIVQQMSEDFYR